MRHFHSYGPVDVEEHFCVERRDLIEQCAEQLVGNAKKGGHYFTIWGSRQTGKTWIMRRAIEEIRTRYGTDFLVATLSMQGTLEASDPPDTFLRRIPGLFREGFGLKPAALTEWDGWLDLFAREGGLFDKPLILLIDEFDALPSVVIDRLVSMFRKMYLARDQYMLHGLALVGVRAVLGVDSPRGSPFNVQRSLQIPNLTQAEVVKMFDQYQAEAGQVVEPDIVAKVYDTTRGRPGLVGWFGELLTEKYNPGKDKPITLSEWERIFMMACRVEPNNNVLNLIKKASAPYRDRVLALFSNPGVPFSFDQDWCNYLYAHGIIDHEEKTTTMGELTSICRFASPFVQFRLHSHFTDELIPRRPILPLDPLDMLADVFTENGIDAAALCERYKSYLARLKASGKDPFVGEELRSDLGLREAVGHFHLYAWLREAIQGQECAVSPEFPTGNGKVDLLLRTKTHRAVIEVKSYRSAADIAGARQQTARYAKSQRLTEATLAMFVPSNDATVLAKLSSDETIDDVRVVTVAIGWT